MITIDDFDFLEDYDDFLDEYGNLKDESEDEEEEEPMPTPSTEDKNVPDPEKAEKHASPNKKTKQASMRCMLFILLDLGRMILTTLPFSLQAHQGTKSWKKQDKNNVRGHLDLSG